MVIFQIMGQESKMWFYLTGKLLEAVSLTPSAVKKTKYRHPTGFFMSEADSTLKQGRLIIQANTSRWLDGDSRSKWVWTVLGCLCQIRILHSKQGKSHLPLTGVKVNLNSKQMICYFQRILVEYKKLNRHSMHHWSNFTEFTGFVIKLQEQMLLTQTRFFKIVFQILHL